MNPFRRLFQSASATEPNYVREWVDHFEFIEHLDGVDWADAPIPPRRHKCWAQTRALLRSNGGRWDFIRRCACAAISFDGEHWMERNTRSPQTGAAGTPQRAAANGTPQPEPPSAASGTERVVCALGAVPRDGGA